MKDKFAGKAGDFVINPKTGLRERVAVKATKVASVKKKKLGVSNGG